MGKKWLTETEGYNIITQCDVVRDTLANSPGDGILSAVSDISAFLAPAFPITYIRGKFRG